MEKLTTKLGAQDRVILFCVATGIDYGSVGIIDHAMQSMAVRGFIAHNRESGAYYAHGQRPRYTHGHPCGCRDGDHSVTPLHELLAVRPPIQNISSRLLISQNFLPISGTTGA